MQCDYFIVVWKKTEETVCKILSDCRGECDLEAKENEENLESSLDTNTKI